MREIRAKALLARVPGPDPWFGLRYNLNLYRGCQHRCIYCDSRSECYGIEDFDGEVLVKANAIELLRSELPRRRRRGTVGLGSMNDPYMPLERERRLTREALEAIADFRFGVHVITKSDLVLRDVDVLARVSASYASVSFTVTTPDDALAAKVEPGAPRPSSRFRAMRRLADAGIQTGVVLMPVLPFLEDDPASVTTIADQAASAGASYIIPSFGVTLRDRQRAYYYAWLDRLFPGVRRRYERAFGGRYACGARDPDRLAAALQEACARNSLATRVPPAPEQSPIQPRLL